MDELKNENIEETESLTPETEVVEEAATEGGNVLTKGVMNEKDMQKVTTQQRIMKILVQIGLYLFLGFMALISASDIWKLISGRGFY